MNRPRLLGCLSFFIFIFAVFSLERIICVHLYLFPDNFLRHFNSMSNARGRIWIVTVAWTPDCFRSSISVEVSGWTNCPSFMSSFVASVSSVSTSLKVYQRTKILSYQFLQRQAAGSRWLFYRQLHMSVRTADLQAHLLEKSQTFPDSPLLLGVKFSGEWDNSECNVRISLQFTAPYISGR